MRCSTGSSLIISLLLCLGGCATTYELPSPGSPAQESNPLFDSARSLQRPTATTINSHVQRKIHRRVAVVISDKDMALEHDVHMGLTGFLMPERVYPGRTLKAYSYYYLTELFDSVTFDQGVDSDLTFFLGIKAFNISALKNAAHLEVAMSIRDKTGNKLHANTYSADGTGHPLLYISVSDQEKQIVTTITQAYEQSFNLIVDDIQKVIQ